MNKKVDIVLKALEGSGVKKITMGFSTGKDSVVGYDIMKKAGIEIIPIYFYIVPELEFIENNIKIYEDFFQTKIHRLPHPILYDYINKQDWQPLHRIKTFAEFKLKRLNFRQLTDVFLNFNNITDVFFDANCMKEADSINRRLLLRKKDYVDYNTKTVYPCKLLTNTEIYDYLKINNIPKTDDYKYFGRSWDGLNYHFLFGVKKYYPNDYAKILEYFPLIELEIMRYKMYIHEKCKV